MTEYQRLVLQLLTALVAKAVAKSGDQERKAIALGAQAIGNTGEALDREIDRLLREDSDTD